ncbi:MAG: tyrosine-type recombinase/integrase [Chloroflexi bacterium]|nr:tyrosine-type recombinase/integrase [Chloroflexota bacterium]
MTVKQVSDLHLFAIRQAGKAFLISLQASNRYAKGYLRELELAVALLSAFAEDNGWPEVTFLTTTHLEEYLLHLQTRPRWFGRQGKTQQTPSQSYIETQYRRLKRFFNWLVQRGHAKRNPLDLIPHPHIDEKVIPTVSEAEMRNLLLLVDPKNGRTSQERFCMVRNRAILYLLWDTPGRRNELATLTLDAVDLETGAIQVMGKGRRERWMPIGDKVRELLGEYIRLRDQLTPNTDALWVSGTGRAIQPSWLYNMLKRLGERAGISGLHTHRFRHTYAVTALREGMPEKVLEIVGGWRKIPDTYLRTLGDEDARRFHRQISPGDRLGKMPKNSTGTDSSSQRPKGRL